MRLTARCLANLRDDGIFCPARYLPDSTPSVTICRMRCCNVPRKAVGITKASGGMGMRALGSGGGIAESQVPPAEIFKDK